VTASSPNGGNLSYSVSWGDEVYATGAASDSLLYPIQQSATFTHVYNRAGTYTPTFTVTSPNTIVCITTPCPGNGGSAKTSLSVKVGEVTTKPTVTVLSPNGGEIWVQGSIQTIRWSDLSGYFCSSNGECTVTNVVRTYDIKLLPYSQPCTTLVCPLRPIISPYTLANNVLGFSYQWPVGSLFSDSDGHGRDPVPDGQYTVQVCQSGTSVCDSSDSYFQVVSKG
jgi:hypothetical protein